MVYCSWSRIPLCRAPGEPVHCLNAPSINLTSIFEQFSYGLFYFLHVSEHQSVLNHHVYHILQQYYIPQEMKIPQHQNQFPVIINKLL